VGCGATPHGLSRAQKSPGCQGIPGFLSV